MNSPLPSSKQIRSWRKSYYYMYLFYKILVVFQVMQTDIHCVADLGGGGSDDIVSSVYIYNKIISFEEKKS